MKDLGLTTSAFLHCIRGKPGYVPTVLPTAGLSSFCLKSHPAWFLSQELLHVHSEQPVSVLSTFPHI